MVGQGAGQDEQGGQDGEVAADDVGLALEDADEVAGSSWPMLVRATFTIVPSRKTAPDPMTVAMRVHRWRGVTLPVSQIDSPAMPGPVALVGAGEFLPVMAAFDAELLASTGRARPRVVILPTASFPDGEEVFKRWAAMGVAHFGELGAEVEPVLVRDRADADDPAAAQAVGEADLIYLSGGKPAHLRQTLDGSDVGRALVGRPRAGRRPGRLLGRGDGPRRPRLRLPGATAAVAAALGSWPRVRAGGLGRAPLRRLAGADVRAHRAAGAARFGRAGDR